MHRLALVSTVLVLALAGCGNPGSTPASGSNNAASTVTSQSADVPLETGTDGPVTDYADPANWMKQPHDGGKSVDAFYIYPTAFSKASASASDIADVTDAGMRKGAQSAYARQATAFEGVANVFAPYYRQVDATYALGLPPADHAQVIAGAPTIDITAAFAYFVEHLNEGRPFLIVAHSQGSDVATHLLATYLKDHREVADRMIAAYIPGYSVTPDYLEANPHLAFGSTGTDTGVLLSWNTEAPTIAAPNPVLLPGALVINPITWTRSQEAAPASASLGSWLPDANGVFHKVPGYADAQVDTAKGVLITTTPDVQTWSPGGAKAFPRGVFHSFDYPFYYFDVQANAKARVDAYLAGHLGS